MVSPRRQLEHKVRGSLTWKQTRVIVIVIIYNWWLLITINVGQIPDFSAGPNAHFWILSCSWGRMCWERGNGRWTL